MKHKKLYDKSILACLTIMMFVYIVTGCSTGGSKRVNQEAGDISGNSIEIDTCNTCVLDSFQVKQTSMSEGEKMSIHKPVAILFFNQVRFADKYERNGPYDSLKKFLKVKNGGDVAVIRDLKDQYFYFKKIIEPVLIKNSVDVIDSVSNFRLLELQGGEKSVFVDSREYQDQDGVLFFNPGKKPIFWTVDGEIKHCKMKEGVVQQYFRFPSDR